MLTYGMPAGLIPYSSRKALIVRMSQHDAVCGCMDRDAACPLALKLTFTQWRSNGDTSASNS
jgi:hypothetical protein